jgi:hypothetical protein
MSAPEQHSAESVPDDGIWEAGDEWPADPASGGETHYHRLNMVND